MKPPDEIIPNYDGKCPNCGKKLSYIPIDAEVRLVDETKQLRPLEPKKKRPPRKKVGIKKRKVKEKARAYNCVEGSTRLFVRGFVNISSLMVLAAFGIAPRLCALL